MAELTVADVEQYTGGRLAAAADETARLLAAALKAARRYCGWHVTPVQTDSGLVLDGPGGRVLSLPTLRVVSVSALSEDGVALDVGTGLPGYDSTSDVLISSVGLVRKVSGGCWSSKFGGISVSMQHGYDDASDWQSGVLELVDRMSESAGSTAGDSGPLIGKSVDDVSYSWAALAVNEPKFFSRSMVALMDPYRIEPTGRR